MRRRSTVFARTRPATSPPTARWPRRPLSTTKASMFIVWLDSRLRRQPDGRAEGEIRPGQAACKEPGQDGGRRARGGAGGAGWLDIARSIHRSGAAVSLTAKSLALVGRVVISRDGDRLSELDGQPLLGLDPAESNANDLLAAAEEAEPDGRHREAAALYSRCLALDRRDAVAAFNRGDCLREAGALHEAVCEYSRALQAESGFVDAWFNLGCAAAEQGRPEAARRALEHAVARDSAYADAVYNLGPLALEAGDVPAARSWWTRYLEVHRDSEWSRRAAPGLRYPDLGVAARPSG
jgi:tetratricopeptide (TPR) repeat protein